MARLPSLKFNLVGKTNSSSPDTAVDFIAGIVRYGGKKMVIGTGCSTKRKDWLVKSGRVHPDARGASRTNRDLNKIEKVFKELVRRHEDEIVWEEFKQELRYELGKDERPEDETIRGVYEFGQILLNEKKVDLSIKNSTYRSFKSGLQTIREYLDSRERDDITFEEIDYNFLLDWNHYLMRDRRLSDSTIGKRLRQLKEIMFSAEKRGYHSNSKFKEKDFRFKESRKKTRHIILDQTEIDAIRRLLHNGELSAHLTKVAQLFLIGIYSGQRWSDYSNYTPDNFRRKEGKLLIVIDNQQKTGTMAAVPVHPDLLPIVEQLGYTSPRMSSQVFNESVKKLCHLAGLNQLVNKYVPGKSAPVRVPRYELVASHTARRTFISLAKLWGWPDSLIQAATGHKTNKQLAEYDKNNPEDKAVQLAILQAEQLSSKVDNIRSIGKVGT